jgi:hypothetical protein
VAASEERTVITTSRSIVFVIFILVGRCLGIIICPGCHRPSVHLWVTRVSVKYPNAQFTSM